MMKRHRDVYVVGIARGANAERNAMAGFTFLSHVVRLCHQYFGSCDENSIRGNFVLLYELLDEICDDGYPQITAGETLKTFITQKSPKMDALASKQEQERAARDGIVRGIRDERRMRELGVEGMDAEKLRGLRERGATHTSAGAVLDRRYIMGLVDETADLISLGSARRTGSSESPPKMSHAHAHDGREETPPRASSHHHHLSLILFLCAKVFCVECYRLRP